MDLVLEKLDHMFVNMNEFRIWIHTCIYSMYKMTSKYKLGYPTYRNYFRIHESIKDYRRRGNVKGLRNYGTVKFPYTKYKLITMIIVRF